MNEHELIHYGILGQKWGVRRYENNDGTLTAAGRKRYASTMTKDGRARYSVTKYDMRYGKKEAERIADARNRGISQEVARKQAIGRNRAKAIMIASAAVIAYADLVSGGELHRAAIDLGKTAVNSIKDSYLNASVTMPDGSVTRYHQKIVETIIPEVTDILAVRR